MRTYHATNAFRIFGKKNEQKKTVARKRYRFGRDAVAAIGFFLERSATAVIANVRAIKRSEKKPVTNGRTRVSVTK